MAYQEGAPRPSLADRLPHISPSRGLATIALALTTTLGVGYGVANRDTIIPAIAGTIGGEGDSNDPGMPVEASATALPLTNTPLITRTVEPLATATVRSTVELPAASDITSTMSREELESAMADYHGGNYVELEENFPGCNADDVVSRMIAKKYSIFGANYRVDANGNLSQPQQEMLEEDAQFARRAIETASAAGLDFVQCAIGQGTSEAEGFVQGNLLYGFTADKKTYALNMVAFETGDDTGWIGLDKDGVLSSFRAVEKDGKLISEVKPVALEGVGAGSGEPMPEETIDPSEAIEELETAVAPQPSVVSEEAVTPTAPAETPTTESAGTEMPAPKEQFEGKVNVYVNPEYNLHQKFPQMTGPKASDFFLDAVCEGVSLGQFRDMFNGDKSACKAWLMEHNGVFPEDIQLPFRDSTSSNALELGKEADLVTLKPKYVDLKQGVEVRYFGPNKEPENPDAIVSYQHVPAHGFALEVTPEGKIIFMIDYEVETRSAEDRSVVDNWLIWTVFNRFLSRQTTENISENEITGWREAVNSASGSGWSVGKTRKVFMPMAAN